ncbi:metallophosphoesterase (plasmid) [Haloterrigena turkmenica DSM 5511]|uniref:Metallophosphoesterase n=1 Tax=Haloterrigena turkmenica (strain ATCC 51198 / DSM 5511 / JCM 9101 / NCIMB 13204 / VKM B-1734 / 4k) TaxID=543526 RepID=D2S0B9_HALTV|nr:metallophosphoesterase [Haloterrigena turkmenica]ADB62816.1 metallophosphoesterase [Haloterrigena turkmenica DSM 5511]
MRLLVLGDLHLGEDGFDAEPHPSWDRFDAALTVGDVAHSSVTVTDGKPQQEELVGIEEAQAFFRRLDDLDVLVLTVPGNHDYRRHADLIRETTRVRNLHRETYPLEGYCAFGLGSETFDAGPEVRYDPDAVTEPDDPDAWLERALKRAGRDEADATLAELRERIDAFDDQFATYTDRYETLRSLATGRESETNAGRIALTHVPPFDTSLDRVAESVPRIGGRHWGSIALKNVLNECDISFVACGHVHEREGVATVADTPCLNAGFRSAYDVTLEGDDVSIVNTDPLVE